MRSILVQTTEFIVRSRTTQDSIGDLEFTYHGPKPPTMPPIPAPFPTPTPAMDPMPDNAPATHNLRPTSEVLQTMADTNFVLNDLRTAMAQHDGSQVVPDATLEFITVANSADDWENNYQTHMNA